MTDHIIIYEGTRMSLGLIQKSYGPTYVPWPNRRTDVNGTLQRGPYWPEDFDEWVDLLRKSKGKNEAFAVLVHEGEKGTRTYRYIGNMGIHGITWPSGYATTGSILGGDDGRGKGYGTEAKLWIQYHAFMILGLRKLSSEVKAFNAGSLGHLLKCGYRIIGRRKAHDFHEGSFVDTILLECFPEDWEPIWNGYRSSETLPKLSEEQQELVRRETNQKD